DKLKDGLTAALVDHPYVGDIRGKGLLIGLELVKDKQTKEPLEVSQVNKVIAGCLQRGLIIGKNGATVAGYNNVLTLAPPLSISEEDLEFVQRTLIEEIKSL
ncbi:aminotransferase class III-fold pyridoxal phosphate-dependent enzyme, partial [Aeromonas veronii]|nr:aminotransferase class III-fold pyridoxal phosphate-dependent enzyme [Aeromonas veronii]